MNVVSLHKPSASWSSSTLPAAPSGASGARLTMMAALRAEVEALRRIVKALPSSLTVS